MPFIVGYSNKKVDLLLGPFILNFLVYDVEFL